MNNLWNNDEANQYLHDPLQLRVYSSRLLGKEPSLVLHGGGNTSVKATVTNRFGETEEILYVKGSGWDLETIEPAGFAPVKLAVLKKLANLEQLSDTEMVKLQRAAMTDPNAPNPSVEAILHAIIPFTFVDHTHADAVVTITNTEHGHERMQAIYGQRVLIIPYIMPGFMLAKQVYQITQHLDWQNYEGLILLNHGLFTFGHDANTSYTRMINLVSLAENYLEQQQAAIITPTLTSVTEDLLELARIRRAVAKIKGTAVVAKLETDAHNAHFANLPNVANLATRGPLTPDHVIRTKPWPMLLNQSPEAATSHYAKLYQEYFNRHNHGQLTCLNPAPCWAIWPGHGTLTFGNSLQEADIIADLKNHTIRAIQQAELLGGWKALPAQAIFDMEYWELEQAKLRKSGTRPPLQGKIAIVTGAASGIGRACVETLQAQGASVVAIDINPNLQELFKNSNVLGLPCDVTDPDQVKQAVTTTLRHFGGLDILISNAGTFPPSEKIVDLANDTWNKSLAINLSSHQSMLHNCIPYLALGLDPAIVIMASKNVPAPGPGVSAYSVAKAGLTQLARVAALELAPLGIRVNVIHPNAVFDTAIWTSEVLEKRAQHYGLTVAEYKTNNLLKVEITSNDVAALAAALVGPLFSKTTGAQIPIDGGNERVI